MKKLLLFIVALFTLSTVHAELILHESFARPVGKLNVGATTSIANTENWYTKNANATNLITVVEESLSWTDYAAAVGNKALLITATKSLSSDMRMLKKSIQLKDGDKVYLSAIINVDELNRTAEATTTTTAYCLALNDGTTSGSKQYARLYIRSVKEGDEYVGFKLGVTKNNETGGGIPFTETVYSEKTDYLVVLEYESVSGGKNDIARLYVNPIKSTTPPTPTLVCTQSFVNSNDIEQGAKAKDDAAEIKAVILNQVLKYNPNRLYVDEIKVATTWAELFEDGSTPSTPTPEIILPTSTLNFGDYVFSGNTYTSKFIVKGKNLNGDITLTSSHTDVTLDKTTITKAEAEVTDGVEVTATLLPTIAGDQSVTVTLSSEGADNSTLVGSWNAFVYTPCATVAELVQELEKSSGTTNSVYVQFTGNAIVSYKATEEIRGGTYNFIYMQDNTAGIRIRDTYWADAVKQGDEITDFRLEGEDPKSTLLAEPVSSYTTTLTVVSQNNEITPQVVTLAELKTNAANYLNKLVKVENVTLDQTSTTFKGVDADNHAIIDKITQNGNEATLSIVDSNPLVGTTKPKKADIIGISTNKLGNAIRPRGLADVISKDSPTAIESIALDMLNGNYEIYTVSGMRVEAFQPGVNIIRQGDKTYKVVR